MRNVIENIKGDEDRTKVTAVDWKSAPLDTLDAVDALLSAFGLEVVIIETGDDQSWFRIEPRDRAPPVGFGS